MYKVEWKDTAGRGCVEEVVDLSAALAFAKALGITVTINGVAVDEDWTNDNEKVFTLAAARRERRQREGDI
jgi:hypothetical protein